MKCAQEFINDLPELPRQKPIRTLTKDEEETRIEIIEYILSHKNEVNYSNHVFKKLENKLKEYMEEFKQYKE